MAGVSDNAIWYLFQVFLKGDLLGGGTSDATWHSMRTGEIFYTDGISRTEKLRIRSNVYGIDQSLLSYSLC